MEETPKLGENNPDPRIKKALNDDIIHRAEKANNIDDDWTKRSDKDIIKMITENSKLIPLHLKVKQLEEENRLLKIEASTAKEERERQFEEDQKVIEELKSNMKYYADMYHAEISRLQGKVKEAWHNGYFENRGDPKKCWEQWSKENNI